jgi:hypothetical protein
VTGNGFLDEDASGLFLLDDLTGRVDMWLEDDPADASGVMLRATEADPNFPAEGDVRDSVVFGYLDEYIGSWLGNVPTPPLLVCENQKNGGDVVATISGSDPGSINDIYVSQFGQNGPVSWVLIDTITGDGTITFQRPVGLYVCKVVSREP